MCLDIFGWRYSCLNMPKTKIKIYKKNKSEWRWRRYSNMERCDSRTWSQSVVILTQNIFGSQLQEVLKLEVDINNSHAASDGQNDYITTGGLLEENRTYNLLLAWRKSTSSLSKCYVHSRLTSLTLGQLFQLHIWLLAGELFMFMRQTVTARVPTITSQGWEATSRPWRRKRRPSIVDVEMPAYWSFICKATISHLKPKDGGALEGFKTHKNGRLAQLKNFSFHCTHASLFSQKKRANCIYFL